MKKNIASFLKITPKFSLSPYVTIFKANLGMINQTHGLIRKTNQNENLTKPIKKIDIPNKRNPRINLTIAINILTPSIILLD